MLHSGGKYGDLFLCATVVVYVNLVIMESINDLNTEEKDKGQSNSEPDFSAESFVTRLNPTNDISSMLSSLYVNSDGEQSNDYDDDDERDEMLCHRLRFSN